MPSKTLGERSRSAKESFFRQKPVTNRNGQLKLEQRLDPRQGTMVEIPKVTSWARRSGMALLLFAGVSLVSNPEEFTRDIVSAETSGAVTIVSKSYEVITGSISGGSEGLCETADNFCDEVGDRATGVGNAITGTEATEPDRVTVDDQPVTPPSTTTVAPVDTATTTTAAPTTTSPPTTTMPETTTTLAPAPTEAPRGTIEIGPLVCTDILANIEIGDNPTPAHAAASLSPDLAGQDWSLLGPLWNYVVNLPSNANLPAENEYTRNTIIYDVPTDCQF